MLKTKTFYETPGMKVFEMHPEGVMCQSGSGQSDYNPLGLRNLYGEDVQDQSDEWEF